MMDLSSLGRWRLTPSWSKAEWSMRGASAVKESAGDLGSFSVEVSLSIRVGGGFCRF